MVLRVVSAMTKLSVYKWSCCRAFILVITTRSIHNVCDAIMYSIIEFHLKLGANRSTIIHIEHFECDIKY